MYWVKEKKKKCTSLFYFLDYAQEPCSMTFGDSVSHFLPLQLSISRSSLSRSTANCIRHSFGTPRMTDRHDYAKMEQTEEVRHVPFSAFRRLVCHVREERHSLRRSISHFVSDVRAIFPPNLAFDFQVYDVDKEDDLESTFCNDMVRLISLFLLSLSLSLSHCLSCCWLPICLA
jgi:hypothetical protein